MARGVFRALDVEHDILEAPGLRRGLALLRAQTGRVDLVIVMGLTQAGGTPYAAGVTLLPDIFNPWPWIPGLVFPHPGPGPGLRAHCFPDGGPARPPPSPARPPPNRALPAFLRP